MYVYLDQEGREEPPESFGKSITKMAVMHRQELLSYGKNETKCGP